MAEAPHERSERTRSSRGHGSRQRRKLDIDLGTEQARLAVGQEQIDYYRERASWFDDCYTCTGDYDAGPERNSQWRQDLNYLTGALGAAGLHGDCVELGAGTGWWGEHIVAVQAVDHLSMLDSSSEMLAIAEQRLTRAGATFETAVVDLWSWKPDRQWDSAVAVFFLEHVPDAVLPGFLQTLHAALRPGAKFFVAEGAWDGHEPVVETRDIGGVEYRVVERRRSPAEFTDVFGQAGFSVTFGRSERYVDLVATRV